jgi:hypothetical protein
VVEGLPGKNKASVLPKKKKKGGGSGCRGRGKIMEKMNQTGVQYKNT